MRKLILFYHCGADWIRGSEEVLLSILERLDRRRFEPVLICNSEIMATAARERAGVSTHVIHIPEVMWDGSHRRLELGGWFRAVRQLTAMLRSGASLLYCNSGLPSQTGYYAARRARVPMICHIHSPYNLRYALLYRFHRATATVFVSDFVRRHIEQKIRFPHTPRVIYNGVDVERMAPPKVRDRTLRAAMGFDSDEMVLGQVGSLIPRKGVDLLIRAVASMARTHPRLRLVLVGDGPEGDSYRALSRDLGVADRVVFAGYQADPAPFYRHVFDINALASRSEAMGLSLLEGAACGLPGIGAQVGGIPEVLVDRETGLLFPMGDHQALAGCIAALAGDSDLRSRLGRRAREDMCTRFSLERQVEAIEALIHEHALG